MQPRSAFAWWDEAKQLRSQLTPSARQWDPAVDFYAVEPLAPPPADAERTVKAAYAASIALLPKWLPHYTTTKPQPTHDDCRDAALLNLDKLLL